MIPAEEIEKLAELYDGFAHALDPFSEERDKAEDEFYQKLQYLKSLHAPTADLREFRREALRQCKLFLKKN